MGAKLSKEQLLYQQVNHGNVEGIKTLRRQGATLEWVDKEGNTPLILSCMRPDLLHVAKVLIEMGANVNVYRPGSHAGTPLHHAAKRGLESTVTLLLSHGANPLLMNDDFQSPLDVARLRKNYKVVRSIEKCICLFSGWLREITGPSILEAFVPQLASRKIWAVVLPCNSRNPTNPQKFELAIYSNQQVSQPRTVLALWKAQIEEPKFNKKDPALIVIDTTQKTRSKFLAANEGDKHQMQLLYNACRGMYQFSHMQHINLVSPPAAAPPLPTQCQATNKPCPEDVELAMAINASIKTAIDEGAALCHGQQVAGAGQSGWSGQPASRVPEATTLPKLHTSQTETPPVSHRSQVAPCAPSVPSAPPIYASPIHYQPIDSSSIDVTMQTTARKAGEDGGNKGSDSYCVICLDAAVEGACVPCGHMVGCMPCLKEIKTKKGECPVCRARIEQVVKIYAV